MKPQFLFVYGTLKKGHGAHVLMADCEYVRDQTLHGYALYDDGLPVVIQGAPKDVVHGELYKVWDWTKLDRYEGFYPDNIEGSLYRRVSFPNLEDLDIHFYLYNGPMSEGAVKRTNGVW